MSQDPNAVRDRESYDYEEVPAADILRPLDPTEHNMERLNRMGRGAGVVYQTAGVRGPLDRAALEDAVRALTRHEALRIRVVRGPDRVLGFAAVEPCMPAIRWIDAHDSARAWARHVEADMNAGPTASHHGSAFRVFVHTNGDEHAITLAAPHHVWDGRSSIALMRELLEQIAEPRALPRVPLRAVESPFVASCATELRSRLGHLAREVTAWADAEPLTRCDLRAPLSTALEKLEADLLASGDGHAWPAELLDVQRLISDVGRWHPDRQHIVADVDPGAPPERSHRVYSGLFVDVIGAAIVTRLVAAARERGITMHGVFGGAALVAHAARHWVLTGIPAKHQMFPIASPISLRQQFQPPLADGDVRMAVDVALTALPVEPTDRFWDVAARFSASIAGEVQSRRALGSWFRTERRPMELPLSGVPVPLVSNIGRVAMARRYGHLELLELHACMSTHSMFQIAMLVQTLGDVANVCYYHELPTVSRESMRRLMDAVNTLLERVAVGQNPTVGDAVRH